MPPNWDDIGQCPIWKAFTVLACDACDGKEDCWGVEINLPIETGLLLGMGMGLPIDTGMEDN